MGLPRSGHCQILITYYLSLLTPPGYNARRKVTAMSHDTPVSAPKFPVPPGACDTHMHIYEPGYALREGAPHSGQPGTLRHYLEIKKKLGLTRTVIVQPSGYGTDNTCTVDA